MEFDTLKIRLDTSQYRKPTQEDVAAAKKYILRRNDYARLLESKIDDLLEEAAQKIVAICYRYNIDPKKFSITSDYNEEMMEEIAAVMDELEEEILSLIYDYSRRKTVQDPTDACTVRFPKRGQHQYASETVTGHNYLF